jgi:hypothetical protein
VQILVIYSKFEWIRIFSINFITFLFGKRPSNAARRKTPFPEHGHFRDVIGDVLTCVLARFQNDAHGLTRESSKSPIRPGGHGQTSPTPSLLRSLLTTAAQSVSKTIFLTLKSLAAWTAGYKLYSFRIGHARKKMACARKRHSMVIHEKEHHQN